MPVSGMSREQLIALMKKMQQQAAAGLDVAGAAASPPSFPSRDYTMDQNMRIAGQNPGDGQIAAVQGMYGDPAYPPAPYTEGLGGDQGLAPERAERMRKIWDGQNPGTGGMAQVPGDIPGYPEGHRQVDPAYSKNLNMAITARDTTDGNIGGLESMYGAPGNVPNEYSGSEYGMTPQDMQQYGGMSKAMDASMQNLVRQFGPERAQQIIDELMRQAAEIEAQGGSPMLTQPGQAMSNMAQRQQRRLRDIR